MSVKNFKFVSPGVFINEIDNSFIPKSAELIGPVVIGRAKRGLAMQPIKVESYSKFVEVFGETVPGGGGGDVYRDGNYQSPMYGTYAAKAFLNANVAPLTYVRLLGQQSVDQTGATAAKAGWATSNNNTSSPVTTGGAYGLWLFTSGAARDLGTGQLAAIFYCDDGSVRLSGSLRGGGVNQGVGNTTHVVGTASVGAVIGNDSSNLFTVLISGSTGTDTIKFGFDDNSETFIRKACNTNPQLVSAANTFYPSSSAKDYWLGESFEQELRDNSLTGDAQGVILAICSGSSGGSGPQAMRGAASREARTGWFVAQSTTAPAAYVPFDDAQAHKLFRLIGRGHGEWLHKNCKVSIEQIRQSNSSATDYGTFSVVIRALGDDDSAVQVMERFDKLTLDPGAPNFIARKIGDQYTKWDSQAKRLRTYGMYPNQSKFVYVEMDSAVEDAGTDAILLPFGYFGPPKFKTVSGAFGTASYGQKSSYVKNPDHFFITGAIGSDAANFLSGGGNNVAIGNNMGANTTVMTGSLAFPSVRLRVSASDGGLSNPTNAYFGMDSSRTAASTRSDRSVADFHRRLYGDYGAGGTAATTAGVDDFAYVFSLDDVVALSSTKYYYQSGSRVLGTSATSGSYVNLLNAGYDRFTAPFFGGFDGFDITKPDPVYNGAMGASSTEANSYVYHTWKRAIDTVSDPEQVDMNLLAAPGLTLAGLTTHMVNTCEDRADALAVIDLPDVYTPAHEGYKSSKDARITTTPTLAANALRDRRIDSSYGCTFYPWVQTSDASGRLLWIPPSVAMLGVLASSERASDIWFAPAGFNRGGLSEGAAGIPVTAVTERLISKDRDVLYEARINPIASFPSSGIVVFGQKTLQERPSALDRINVRRLVIYLKKQISILSTQILFEQNVQATWTRFKGLVEPFLANVLTGFGITDYRLILDESTTTPDLIDQNVMYAKIMIKPARAIEYIAIDFVIASTGASFDD